MVCKILPCIVILFLVKALCAFPGFEGHHDMKTAEIGGDQEVFDHIGVSHDYHEIKPKYATSYQSFHLESKHPVPVLYKKEQISPAIHISHEESPESYIHHAHESLKIYGY